jgi:lipocalin-like protein
MESLVGVWKLVEARAFDDAGRELPPPLGSQPMGLALFESERMVGVIGDARASLPTEVTARFFAAYTGTYRLDGDVLVTKADDASKPELIVEQVRRVRFHGPNRFTAIPISGIPGYSGINVVWERVG